MTYTTYYMGRKDMDGKPTATFTETYKTSKAVSKADIFEHCTRMSQVTFEILVEVLDTDKSKGEEDYIRYYLFAPINATARTWRLELRTLDEDTARTWKLENII